MSLEPNPVRRPDREPAPRRIQIARRHVPRPSAPDLISAAGQEVRLEVGAPPGWNSVTRACRVGARLSGSHKYGFTPFTRIPRNQGTVWRAQLTDRIRAKMLPGLVGGFCRKLRRSRFFNQLISQSIPNQFHVIFNAELLPDSRVVRANGFYAQGKFRADFLERFA